MRTAGLWALLPVAVLAMAGCGPADVEGCPSGDGLSIEQGRSKSTQVDVLAGFVRQSNVVVNGRLYVVPQAPETSGPAGLRGPGPDLPSEVLDGRFTATIAVDGDLVSMTVAGKRFPLQEIICG